MFEERRGKEQESFFCATRGAVFVSLYPKRDVVREMKEKTPPLACIENLPPFNILPEKTREEISLRHAAV